jgi:hypothetical protein
MKNYGLFFLLIIAISINSCTWKKPGKSVAVITTDTLHYTYKTFKQRAADCGNKADSNCSIVKFVYPVVDSMAVLNDSVVNKLTGIFPSDKKTDTGFTALAQSFLANYQKGIKGLNNPPLYTLDGNAKILRQDSSLVTLQIYAYSFTGGAHPSSLTYFINWNTKANKKIMLSDIFKDNVQDSLKIIAESIFRKNEKLSPTATLKNDYFFKDGKFALNGNYVITPAGIRFLYNEYEIKPYAAGTTDLFIPYSQIKMLLRPNTVVSQYIK